MDEDTNVRNVSKKIFLDSLVCPTLGWVARSRAFDDRIGELSLADRFRVQQGIEIGRRARELYPSGILIDEGNVASACRRTKIMLGRADISAIFEATFAVDGYTAKADILEREDEGWRIVEVKSSVNDRKEFIDDMAYTTMVVKRCGLEITDTSLLLISRDFKLGMENEKLFEKVNHTPDVLRRAEEFTRLWSTIEKMTRSPLKPDPELRLDCRTCRLFKECLGENIEHHILDIPRLTESKLIELAQLGIVCVEDIPDAFSLTESQLRVRDCVKTRKPFIEDGLKSALQSVSWPAYYLDFETVMTAIPFYAGIAPYTQLPTQYSIHKCSKLGQVTDHFEYLADPSRDCRREIAENLIDVLREGGSIIVYSHFEKSIMTKLAALFPDLAIGLASLITRIVNLEAMIRQNFYHPDFHGSTSIKRTLPVLVSDMSYDHLEIADGGSAMAAFGYLILGKAGKKTLERLRRDLLDYCKQDTLAMVRLHQRLAEYV